jgi:hypothetical protein
MDPLSLTLEATLGIFTKHSRQRHVTKWGCRPTHSPQRRDKLGIREAMLARAAGVVHRSDGRALVSC